MLPITVLLLHIAFYCKQDLSFLIYHFYLLIDLLLVWTYKFLFFNGLQFITAMHYLVLNFSQIQPVRAPSSCSCEMPTFFFFFSTTLLFDILVSSCSYSCTVLESTISLRNLYFFLVENCTWILGVCSLLLECKKRQVTFKLTNIKNVIRA